MARYVSDRKLEDVRKLIKHTTHFQPHIKDVKQAMYGIIEKLTLHANFQRAEYLKEVYEKLLAIPDISPQLAVNTYTADEKEKEDSIDWHAYLMEGVEIDPAIGQESSDESVWSLEDEDAVTENEAFHRSHSSSENEDYLTELASELETLSMNQRTLEHEAQHEEEELESKVGESWKAMDSGYQFPATQPSQHFPAANFITSWLDREGQGTSVRVLSEYMIVRELLWALRDPTASGLVFQYDDAGKFSVAKDLAVCSLTPKALQAALSKFCPVLELLYEMQTFVDDLIPSIDKDTKFPLSTYKAYASGLNIIFTQQNAILLDLEKKVMMQDKTATVQSVSGILHDWVQFQLALFSIHKKASEDWKTEDAWMCAAKLLSVLGEAVDTAQSLQMSAVILSLLLCSLKPYLDITENWLKSGNLQDPHSEFLIFEETVNIQDSSSTAQSMLLEGNYERRPYETVLKSKGIDALSLLKPLVNQGEVAGRSIQLLQGLKAMDSIPHPDNKESLHTELLNMLRSKLLPTVSAVEDSDPGFQDVDPVESLPEQTPSTLDQYMRDYLLSCNDTYMLKAFGDVLDLGLDVTHPQEDFILPKAQLLFKTGEVGILQPVRPLLHCCMEQLMVSHVQGLGQRAQQLLHERCCLGTHLAAVRGVALLEAGMEWPITLVFREDNLEMYNRVFRFLAKVKCALITLHQLRFQDLKCEATVMRRMSVLRSWLLFLLGSIQENLLGHILTTLREQLDLALTQATDLHSALAAHDAFVVALAMSLAEEWRHGEVTEEWLAGLESDYDKLYTFLLHLFTNLTRFGANLHLAGVAAALIHSSPPYQSGGPQTM
ncbi:hypothetical protein B566_EDAN011307 [Ephemera danica]|nr:hypothetical protein B566_EDAN011307 [Ephemera danica]